MIKSVVQAIPTYTMGLFTYPDYLLAYIQGMVSKFWWGQTGERKKIHWVSWDRLCAKKEAGGMGFRHLKSFNQALFAKNLWHFIHDPTSLVAQVSKSRYCPRTDFLDASIGYKPPPFWRSIWGVRWLIEMGYRLQVGNGCETNVWSDRWLPKATPGKVLTRGSPDDPTMLVCELIDFEGGQWKEEKVRDLFGLDDAGVVLRIPLSLRWPSDIRVWHYTN